MVLSYSTATQTSSHRQYRGQAIWPTKRWIPVLSHVSPHCIADHEWRCWPRPKNAQTVLAHADVRWTVRPPTEDFCAPDPPICAACADERQGSHRRPLMADRRARQRRIRSVTSFRARFHRGSPKCAYCQRESSCPHRWPRCPPDLHNCPFGTLLTAARQTRNCAQIGTVRGVAHDNRSRSATHAAIVMRAHSSRLRCSGAAGLLAGNVSGGRALLMILA